MANLVKIFAGRAVTLNNVAALKNARFFASARK